MAWGMVSDIRTLNIPNVIPVILFVLFLPASLMAGWSFGDIALQYGAGLALLVPLIFLYAGGYIGGGDLKLLVATAVWIGWQAMATYLITAALIGGGLALIVLSLRKMPELPYLRRLPWLRPSTGPAEGIPYGVAIAVAAIILFPRLDIALAGEAALARLF
jgi:prepilin peptidase CpaA